MGVRQGTGSSDAPTGRLGDAAGPVFGARWAQAPLGCGELLTAGHDVERRRPDLGSLGAGEPGDLERRDIVTGACQGVSEAVRSVNIWNEFPLISAASSDSA